MIDALNPVDRALWALAFYAGLRLGELRGLRWCDVDFEAGVIHVERAWCNRASAIVTPKSLAAVRRVPVAGRLRQTLLEARLLAGRPADDDLIAVNPDTGNPWAVGTLQKRRTAAWKGLKGRPT